MATCWTSASGSVFTLSAAEGSFVAHRAEPSWLTPQTIPRPTEICTAGPIDKTGVTTFLDAIPDRSSRPKHAMAPFASMAHVPAPEAEEAMLRRGRASLWGEVPGKAVLGPRREASACVTDGGGAAPSACGARSGWREHATPTINDATSGLALFKPRTPTPIRGCACREGSPEHPWASNTGKRSFYC
jgi:hypothetical protein